MQRSLSRSSWGVFHSRLHIFVVDCPTTIPATALNRLDTIQARLDSTWRATLSIQVALANFEAELNDAQKIRFDTMNFAARESAQPAQRDVGVAKRER
jgi:hypothetical protein